MKKFLSVFLAAVLVLFGIMPERMLYAVESAAITVTSASGKRGETVDVPIVVSGNTGVAAISFDVKYDADRLELLKASDQKLLGSSTATFGNDLSANPYRLCWDDLSDSNNEENGTIVTLTFKVKDNAPVGDADVEIILNENSTFNIDMNNVPFDMVGGTITVDSDGDAAITVMSTSCKRGETVDVPVVVSGNPGVAAISFDVKYDADRLELLKASDQKLLGSSTATFGNDLSANPYRLCWDDLSDSNNEENGTIVTLTFKVKDNVPVGDANVEIILNENSTFDIDMNNVPFDMVGGTITVDSDGNVEPATEAPTTEPMTEPQTTEPETEDPTEPETEPSDEIPLGDVNNSGEIDAIDASLVLADYAAVQTGKKGKFTDAQRKAADVNGDGAADAIDASKILAYYAYIQTGHNGTFKEFITNSK